MKPLTRALLTLLALAVCAGASAQIYKWTDKDGRVHYGDQAPPGVKAEEVSEKIKDATSTYTTDTPLPARPAPAASAAPTTLAGGAGVAVEITPVEFELTRTNEKQIRQEVDSIYRRYVEMFGWSPRAARPVKLRIFGRLEAWEAYPKRIDSLGSRSFYDPGKREVVLHGGNYFGVETLEPLRHEVSHAILDLEVRGVPRWLNEGLAEAFRTGGSGTPRDRAGIEIVQMKIREGSLESWAHYADFGDGTWRSKSAAEEIIYYRVAGSMVSYLLSSPEGTRCLRDVLTQARKSGFGVPSQMFQRFCGGLGDIDAGWRQWNRRL